MFRVQTLKVGKTLAANRERAGALRNLKVVARRFPTSPFTLTSYTCFDLAQTDANSFEDSSHRLMTLPTDKEYISERPASSRDLGWRRSGDHSKLGQSYIENKREPAKKAETRGSGCSAS